MPSNRLITFVYSNTTDGSPLRTLMRDWKIQEQNLNWGAIRHHQCGLPIEFLQDLFTEICRLSYESADRRIEAVFRTTVVDRGLDHYHQDIDKE